MQIQSNIVRSQDIPWFSNPNKETWFERLDDTAQYGESSFDNVVDVRRGISIEEATKIAEENEQIDYFVYVKGYSMLLVAQPGVEYNQQNDPFGLAQFTTFRGNDGLIHRRYCRHFGHGDVVFFKKEGQWLAGAPGLADTYAVHREK